MDKGKKPMTPLQHQNSKRKYSPPPNPERLHIQPISFPYVSPQSNILPEGSMGTINSLTSRQIAQRSRRERERELGLFNKTKPIVEVNPSKAVLAQRARREREKGIVGIEEMQSKPPALEVIPSKAALAQRARWDRERQKRMKPSLTSSTITDLDQSVLGEINDVPATTNAEDSLEARPIIDKVLQSQSMPSPHSAIDQMLNLNALTNNVRSNITMDVNTAATSKSMSALRCDTYDEDDSEEDIYIDDVPHVPNLNKTFTMMAKGRHYLQKMDVQCPFCKALHWKDERLSKSSLRNPLFGTCCLQGKINLPPLMPLPPPMKSLFDGNDRRSTSFRKHMREYNSAFAFTSLGAQMDDRILGRRGPKSFVIHGELRHRTGSLLPEKGQDGKYSQLYIYDPSAAFDVRKRRNPNLREDVLEIIQDTMLQYNRFSKDFRHAYEILNVASREHTEDINVSAYLHYASKKDKRRYNLPTADEIAVILPGDGSEADNTRDIVLHLKDGNGLMRISECHPAYLPLHYVLMFPHGELGWSPELKRWNVSTSNATVDKLTQMDFYSYLLFQRSSEYSPILRGKKLFQEFLVDAWAATEQNKLTWARINQTKIRAELYQGLVDVTAEAMSLDQVGKRIILPSSHPGSPRHMFEIFQDSMAITRFHRHPDIFLTMTANPNWPEITEALLPFQHATDRPDIVARVFELKRRALMAYIKKEELFGKVVAHVYTIEFQKRGLPHMHALLYLRHDDKIFNATQVDRFVCAEFPDPKEDPELFQTVITCMIHGPCGTRNPHAPCMENGKCTKNYPKPFNPFTTMDKNGYPIYHRFDNGKAYKVRGYIIDNRDIVPYNPHLSRMFNCHINVEVCAGIRCVKYIHKYIFKGHDMTTMVLNGIDEILQYLDSRYIGPPEAAWRLFGFSMHEEVPNVVRLALHLPGQHLVIYDASDSIEAIIERAQHQKSTLTAFFDCCEADSNAGQYTYQEFPQHYVWHKSDHIWTRRKKGFAIGRMYFAGPNSGERFYLRLLLTVVQGPLSFDDLRTVENHKWDTFKQACVARGLLEDDNEYQHCLQEAAIMKTGYQLRRLFTIILLECNPIAPEILWNEFAENICDDLAHKLRTTFHIPNPTEDQVKDYGLYLLNEMLFESGKSLNDFPPMPLPMGTWTPIIGNRLIWEQQQFQYDERTHVSHARVVKLNNEQREAYDIVMQSVSQNEGKLFFLNGPAGTGKTFVYNTIAATCRSRGEIVTMVASSGIASLLLHGGQTAHSTFKIPLNIMDNSVCGFSKQSLHAALFRETKLIIWDEVPMQHRYCVEAVDRTLRDIRNNDNLFGGITVVLGGDWRQCLPVVPKGYREQIVAASLRKSHLWANVNVMTLVQNMRLDVGNPMNVEFARKLIEIGTKPDDLVQLPSTMNKCANLHALISATYPGLEHESTSTLEYLTERTILSARNDDVNAINAAALDLFPGETIIRLGADKMEEVEANDPTNIRQYPSEYLNALAPSGFPPFQLKLKVGSPIMLLRNLAPKDGMCNGTRLKVECCSDHCIKAKILTGEKSGESVFIPKLSLSPSSSEFPFHMTRRQFPIRLAYAMTINKSQGQSVKFVGVDLRTEVFSHGQLYVALSRCTSAERINILLPPNSGDQTTNIVYPEVLI